jgi:hypothetical protein
MTSISIGKRGAAVRIMMGVVVTLVMTAGIGTGMPRPAIAAPVHQAPTAAIAPSVRPGQRAAVDSSTPCFYTVPDCVSSDPHASFGIVSIGDTSGCTLTGNVDWGDGATSTQTFDGGADGSQLATFDHKYSKDGVYSIDWSVGVASGSCSDNSGTLQFTLFPCPTNSEQTHVTLPTVEAPVKLPGKSVEVRYGSLPLTFKLAGGQPTSICTVQSNRGALPVIIHPPLVPISLHVADSVTIATVDFIPADDPSTFVPTCDFSLLHSLAKAISPVTIADFAETNNCLLSGSGHISGTVIARWSIPGFAEYSPRVDHGVKIYSTPPLTYYVDLSQLDGGLSASTPFQKILQDTETFIHRTLIGNLPMVDKIGIVQDPPANLLVTDPLGRTVGMGSDHKVQTFPGAGYARVGDRSIAWIIEPVPGAYHVTADGKPGSKFHTDFTLLQFLGHGKDPLSGTTQWHGVLGHHGTAARKFAAKGTSLQPLIRAHESRTRARRHQLVSFSLAHSVIPFGRVRVAWTFGDGKTATGKAPSHRYAKAGRFTPTVTVTDALGTSVKVQLKSITVRR